MLSQHHYQLVQRWDSASLLPAQTYERTPQGGIRARARLTRSGVLDYELPDGSVRREWRPPAEVFALESYRTLWDAPITVLHPDEGEVHSETYRRETVGHVCSDVAPDGDFLAGTVIIQDAETVRKTLSRELKEFSPGYLAGMDFTSGVVPAGMPDAGKRYDCIQRRIRYNHAAYLPPGLGRSGPDVSIRLDSKGNQMIGPVSSLRAHALKVLGGESGVADFSRELAELGALAKAAGWGEQPRTDGVVFPLTPEEVKALMRLARIPKLQAIVMEREQRLRLEEQNAHVDHADWLTARISDAWRP